MKIKWFSNLLEKITFSILAIITLIFMNSCKAKQEEDVNKQYCITDLKVTLDTVKSKTVMNELVLSGKITFNEDKVVKVYSLASGHVQEVKVSLGDYVEKGQILVEIQSSDVAGSSNDMIAAQSDVTVAKKNLDASEDMHKSGLLSEK